MNAGRNLCIKKPFPMRCKEEEASDHTIEN